MKSLYVKFAFTTIAIMLLSGIIAFMLSNFYYQQKLKPLNDEKNTKIALDMAAFIEEEDHIELDSYLNNIADVGYQMMLVDQASAEMYYGAPFREEGLPAHTKENVLDGTVYHGIANFPQETFATGFFANELENTIGVPLTYEGEQYALFIRPDIKLLFNEMHFLLAWLLVLTIILSIILVLISTKYLVHPISKMTKATEKLSEGDFDIRLEIGRDDEIGQLAKSFTHMAKQLEALDEMKNEFISNISHDVKSPLANIKGYVNFLDREGVSAAEKDEYITIINQEINRLSNLTKQLLLLASLDSQEELLKKKEFIVSDQLKEIIRSHQWHLEEKGIMVSHKLPEVSVYGDASMLYNVWENLLTNAIKYNEEDGNIDIAVVDHGTEVEVRFQDTGIGLDKKTEDRIFDRFYREDTSRNRTIEGTGLGLAIVASIIELHDGYVKIESEFEEGTSFSVYLPSL